jgi:hypothetical protein
LLANSAIGFLASSCQFSFWRPHVGKRPLLF